MGGETATSRTGASQNTYIKYETIKGYFLQDDDKTDSSEFNFRTSNFGLINRSYETDGSLDPAEAKTQWQRFANHVELLNTQSASNVQYKVLFMGRHGQGWHNVAEKKYGTTAWDCYWSKLCGADGITWEDALLTDVGEGQAEEVYDFWRSHMPEQGGGIPPPESYYVSPLARAIQTAEITFGKLGISTFKPVVKEFLREVIGVHTCDLRRSATHIREMFPSYALEEGFVEIDPLWTKDYREPRSAQVVRMTELLDDIFTNDKSTFISFTSHSGAISSLLEALGHREFGLETGGVIPVLVKAETVDGERKKPAIEPSETAPSCTANPTQTALL
ncbi:phosphoglycerate mutase-like protein [Glonium stellatum]|uniref:Phosphoglycerate mutase-like protein n=1 Tax=Glonium stellatum TaxID=574774 RepID=A0A8E2JQJ1_9PEZI|nr:phosphoglycerate mutase-like protein [Glonium stellatum]